MKLQKSACIETLYTELPWQQRFAAAAKDGFEYVEFWGWPDKDLDEIRRLAEEANVGISGFNGDADLSMVDPEHKTAWLEYVNGSIAAAKKIGARSLTIHSLSLIHI